MPRMLKMKHDAMQTAPMTRGHVTSMNPRWNISGSASVSGQKRDKSSVPMMPP